MLHPVRVLPSSDAGQLALVRIVTKRAELNYSWDGTTLSRHSAGSMKGKGTGGKGRGGRETGG